MLVAVAIVALIGAGSWVGSRYLGDRACAEPERLAVTAAPEVAPVLRAAVTRAHDRFRVGDECVEVEISAAAPADVAAAIAARHGATLTGVGAASGRIGVPDVWVPDSSTWLHRLTAAAPGFRPGHPAGAAGSIGMSPVVVAVPEPVAEQAGWSGTAPSWGDLVSQVVSGDSRLRTGIVDPVREASGLSGLMALAAAVGTGPESLPKMTAALRALAQGRAALRDELLARFPRSTEPAAISGALSAAPLSEQAVIGYNSADPPVPLAALYLNPAPLALDYPFTVLPGLDPTRTGAAEALFRELSGTGHAAALAGQGLRPPDGTTPAELTTPTGAPPDASPTPAGAGGEGAGGPDLAAVERVLASWGSLTRSARMLAVIDVSGSMYAAVPTAGGATRAEVTARAARQGLALFDDSWSVGMWAFSTRLDGDRDYRQLVPIGPLSAQRSEVVAATDETTPVPDGGTGLYDTMLAAYRTVQQDWDPGRVNSVVMLTDGRDDDADSIGLDGLLAELGRIADPEKPIRVIVVGIGTELDLAALRRITEVTGGGVYVAEDPSRIGEIFLQAIASRTQD